MLLINYYNNKLKYIVDYQTNDWIIQNFTKLYNWIKIKLIIKLLTEHNAIDGTQI